MLTACRQSTYQGGRNGNSKRDEDHSGFTDQFDAAVKEGLARANKTLRGITGLHALEEKASVHDGKIKEDRVTMEATSILEG